MVHRGETLVVAGVSVRVLAESAWQAGFEVIALDLFGDEDTRAASRHWAPIGAPGSLAIDPLLLRAALSDAAAMPGVIGWLAGSGFDGAPDLLAAGPPAPPLLGMASDEVRATRDAPRFFAMLARLGLRHPDTCFSPPPAPEGWLAKHSGGTGGWHIRRAADVHPPGADLYFQRELAGTAMSALFLADGQRARVVALNRLLVRPLVRRPFVYRGVIGPIVDTGLQMQVDAALALLVPAFALRGLASLDFVVHEGLAHWLEINPRPSASMVLHRAAWPAGLVAAHLDALHGRLPAHAVHPLGLRGTQVLLARRACAVDSSVARELAALGHVHDRPMPGNRFAPGDPVCSVDAEGDDVGTVEQRLRERLRQAEQSLKTPEEITA